MPVLDSNLLIRLMDGDPRAIATLERLEGEHLAVPAQAAAEFLTGVDERGPALERLHGSFDVRHTTDAHTLAMAELRARARARRLRPRWGDVHVAAQAVVDDTYVVTTNKRHFTQLDVPAWHYLREEDPPERSGRSW